MREITWKNVNSLANSSGVQQAIGNLQQSLSALGNVGTTYIDKRLANEEEYRKNLKQANTDAIINQMQQVQDLQQLAQAKATGVYDLGALQNLSGGLIDGKQFNNAYDSWDKDILGKVQTADTALDYNPETKAALGQYYQAISQGDTARAAELFKNINASRGTTYTLAKDQYNILKDERDYNSKSLKESLDLQNQWIKAKQELETSDEQIKQFEKKAHVGFLGASLGNPNLSKQEYLATLPDYAQLVNKRTAAKVIFDSVNQTYSSYNQGRALGNTSGSPYNSQGERALGQAQTEQPNWYNHAVNEFSERGLPAHVVNAYIGTESNFQPNAKNPKSTATGLGQILKGTWNESAKKLGLPLVTEQNQGTNQDPRFNPKMNIKMSAHQASEAYKRTKDFANSAGYTDEGLIVKVGIFAGSTGANKIWKALKDNPNTPIEKLLSPKAIEANPFLKGKTAKTAIDYFENLVNKQYGSTNSTNTQPTNAQTAKDIVNEATKSSTSVATEVVDNAVKAAESSSFNGDDFINADRSINFEAFKEAAKNRAGELDEQNLQRLKATSSNPFSNQSIEANSVYNQVLDDLVSDKPVDEFSEATKEFIKYFPALDPSNPNSASARRAVIEGLKEYANTNDAVKIKESQEVLQRIIGADRAGEFTIEDFNVPKTIQISSKNGVLTETEQSLKERFFDKSGKLKPEKEVNKQIDALFAQTGLYDQITVRDNIRKAIQATGNPMLILKAYQNAALQTYRYEKGKPNATLEEMVNSNYVPDLDFNSFSGSDFGKQFLQKIDAMAGFNKSTLKTITNQFKLINERHANRGSGAAKIDYIRKGVQTADTNNVVSFVDPYKYWEDNGVITRYNYNEAENKARNEVGKHAREIMNSLPKNAQSFINKINKYGNLDSSEAALIQKSLKDNPVTITPEQYRNIIDITRKNANHPEVQKLIAFMESYGSKLRISDKK